MEKMIKFRRINGEERSYPLSSVDWPHGHFGEKLLLNGEMKVGATARFSIPKEVSRKRVYQESNNWRTPGGWITQIERVDVWEEVEIVEI